MGRYILKRLLWLIPILLMVSFISYFIMYLSPGDPATTYLQMGGEPPTTEEVEALRERMGLNDPFFVQYFRWISNIVLHGDFGTSLYTHDSVSWKIFSLFPNTIYLTITAMVFTLIISIPLGVAAAVFENRFIDIVIRVASFIGGSLPGFFAAMGLTFIFGVWLKWLPTISSGHPEGIILPAVVLAVTTSATYIRQIRVTVIQELSEDYIRLKRSRGIRERVILYRNALKCAMPSFLTIAGMNIGHLLGGTAIIETVCTYQGLGRTALTAIQNRDYPMIQGYVLIMAFVYVMVNLIVDIAHAYVDPRVKNRFIMESRKGARYGKNKKAGADQAY